MSKKSEEKDTKEKKQKSVLPFITGLFLCALGLFLFVAFISYMFQWKKDNPGPEVGELGTGIARSFINFLGLGALPIPVILFFIGFHILRPVKKFSKKILILLIGIFMLLVVPTYLFYGVEGAKAAWFGRGLGGYHGCSLVESLITKIGILGTGLFVIIALVIYGILITPNTAIIIKLLYHKLISFFKNFFKRKETKKETNSKKKTENTTAETNQPNQPVPDKSDDGAFVINRYKDEEKEEKEEQNISGNNVMPEIPVLNRSLEVNTKEIVEEYLPEESLTGELYDPTKDLSGYQRPPVDLLEDYKSQGDKTDIAELNRNKDKIVEILGHYKIGIEKIFATVGPTVTLYEIIPRDGVRIAQIKRLEDDIALRIAAIGVRIIAPMPGKGTVGIEVPNEKPDIVSMRSIIKSAKFQESKFDLPVALGKTILGEIFAFDLAKMPHLLVAGSTGQGKSVGLNAIVTSLLYKKHPAELKIVMVDPKKVELTPYSKIENHFLAKLPDAEDPIITDTQKVVYTLKSLCIEMDSRYDLLKIAGVRNIKDYNEKFINRHLNPLKGHKFMPYIVLIIDEFADLIMTAGREIEEPIARLAQLARAIGIHLVIATQRPTTNIITGLIKANFPARIAFRVTSMVDSRTILDTPGANQLIGRGDMLISAGAELIRVQCAFVDTPEVDRVTDFIKKQPGYGAAYDLPEYVDDKNPEKQIDMKNLDEMFEEAAKVIVENQIGSTSLIQRKLSLGYNRAGRIMDQLQAAGIVGPAEGSKPRQVMITDFKSLDAILQAFRK
ncbi:MAG: DNA translocase FtsK [Prevotellaceae bacterium]|jgi:S-DNA-T family DNA segregation ATPase FtsK/SpoIIIE|nr:DNA translocase FtsK [Prevotellaceae bacterium]